MTPPKKIKAIIEFETNPWWWSEAKEDHLFWADLEDTVRLGLVNTLYGRDTPNQWERVKVQLEPCK